MSDVESDTGIKVVITVCIIIFAVVAAIVIAKLVDRCYDRKIIIDHLGDVDDNMQDLIRTRLSIIQQKKRELQKAKRRNALKVFREWAKKVEERHKKRDKELDDKIHPDSNGDVVITIDRAVSDTKQNGSPRTPRFPFFTGASLAGGAQKPVTKSRVSNAGLETPITVTPVAKGRPVSSTTRAFPNVVVTGVDGNMSKVLPQTFLVEPDVSKVLPQTDAVEQDKRESVSKLLPQTVVVEQDKSSSAADIKQNGIKT